MHVIGAGNLKPLYLAMLSLVVGFVVFAPGESRADCTSHGFRHSNPLGQHSEHEANQAFLARIAKSADQGVMATLRRWFALNRESRVRPVAPFCAPCQQMPFHRGNRCEGPGCSGDPAPATAPLSVRVAGSQETIGILATVQPLPGTNVLRRPVEDSVLPSAISADSIFHPPRTH